MLKTNLLAFIKYQVLSSDTQDGYCRLPHIECNDGFMFSMQFGSGLYCDTYNATSRKDLLTALDNPSDLTFEVGYPNAKEELLTPYDNGDVVYSHVPLDVICEIINKHNGVKQIAKGLIKV